MAVKKGWQWNSSRTCGGLRRGSGIPDADRAVGARGGQALAVGAEGDLVHGVRMAAEGEQFAGAGWVPDLDGPVSRAGGQALAVGAVGNAADDVGMAGELV